MHGSQQLAKWDGREARGVIGQTVRDDQFAVVDQSATGVNDVRHVAFAFVFIWFEQRFVEAADHFGGIITIEEERADAIPSHRANPVAEDQPTCVRLNWGSAVPKLYQFPREGRFKQHLAFMPKVDVVGEHQIDVLVVLAGEHGIEAVYFPREDSHTFVFRGGTIQGNESKKQEIRSLHQLWDDHLAVEGGEGRVVDVGAVIVLEPDEPGIFDAVSLRGSGWE